MIRASISPDKIAKIRALARQNMKAAEIGAYLGMTKNAIVGFCYRNGVALTSAGYKERKFWPSREQPKPVRKHKPCLRRKAKAPTLLPPRPVVIQKPDPRSPSIPMLESGPNSCLYCVGDARAQIICGQPRKPGSSFCADHHALCHSVRHHAAGAAE